MAKKIGATVIIICVIMLSFLSLPFAKGAKATETSGSWEYYTSSNIT